VTSNELKRAKRTVRRSVLLERDALPEHEREAAALAIVRTVLAMEEVSGARTVLAFWSFGSEVPTAPLLDGLHAAGVQVALPRIVAGDIEVRAYAPGDRLSATSFGALEPSEGVVLDPAALDVIITPAVAFDLRGGRIGYGGGFYDRLFPKANHAFRLGIAYDLQGRQEPLPLGGFDLRVHAIVTPTRTIRPAAHP